MKLTIYLASILALIFIPWTSEAQDTIFIGQNPISIKPSLKSDNSIISTNGYIKYDGEKKVGGFVKVNRTLRKNDYPSKILNYTIGSIVSIPSMSSFCNVCKEVFKQSIENIVECIILLPNIEELHIKHFCISSNYKMNSNDRCDEILDSNEVSNIIINHIDSLKATGRKYYQKNYKLIIKPSELKVFYSEI